MNFKEFAPLLVHFAVENKDKWNQLDGAQGDGDLGVTIFLAAQALEENAEACNSMKEWFIVGGKALRKAAPSTMGILLASALIAAGKSIEEDKDHFALEDWAFIQQNMIDEISKRGGAKLGDKTVLDAFIPAAQAFSNGINRGLNLVEILTDVTDVAKHAAESTANLVSKIGRSSWLGERAQGNIDGGAWVCYQVYSLLLNLNKRGQDV
jgi:phosphoenolpyruvate---glycerone phosphotransferase subunit DhaL